MCKATITANNVTYDFTFKSLEKALEIIRIVLTAFEGEELELNIVYKEDKPVTKREQELINAGLIYPKE